MAQIKDLTKGEKKERIKTIIDQITEKHEVLESHHQARMGKKEETAVDIKDVELGDDDDGDDDDGNDDDGDGDDMAELMEVKLAYLEDKEKRKKETEDEKLDIMTGGDEVTEEGDNEEGESGVNCVFFF